MKRAAFLALGLIVLAGAAHAALPPPIARAFRQAGVPLGSVAIVVQETGKPRAMIAHEAAKPMNPASAMKLVTTFAALELLGPDYRWTTQAFLDGSLDYRGVLHGNLVLKGHGDPKITIEQWQAFMTKLVAQGLLEVDGDLVLDRSFFAPFPYDPAAFDGEPLKPYNVGPDALLVNFNAVKFAFAPNATGDGTAVAAVPPLDNVTLGPTPPLSEGNCGDWHAALGASFVDHGASAEATFAGRYPAACGERDWWIALLDHPAYVRAMFAAYFHEAGGRFAGGWKDGRAPATGSAFAVLESPPLYDIIRDVNKLSNNVMARQVFLTLATAKGPPPATAAGASATVKRWLASRGLKMPELVLDNGSGLSRNERISAGSLVRLLLAADASPVRNEFASSLAVAATDGTLERRFQNGDVAGQGLLKTGTLEGARAIAGYLIAADGRRYAIAAIVNHPNANRAQPALDFFVEWIHHHAAAWDALTKH